MSNSAGPNRPDPAVTSVTAGSAAVRSIEPVPPPLTKRSGATARTASTIAARRQASSRAESSCMTGSATRMSGLPGGRSPIPAICPS